MDHMFEPSVGSFFTYITGFLFRYALCAGGVFFLFHFWKRRRFFLYKIQQIWPSRNDVRHEILWSVSNAVCTGVFSMLLYYCIREDLTQMYFDVDERGVVYFILSILLGTFGFDAWFYWQHRLLHMPWFFRNAHHIHHKVHNPTALAAFAHHPIETFFEDFYFLFFIMIIPIHPIALGICGFHAFVLGILGHSGYEFFPRGFTQHKLGRWHNTSTHHNMHHSHIDCNYSLYFNYWDRLMKTNHSDYHDYFNSVKQRLDAPSLNNRRLVEMPSNSIRETR